MVLKSIPPPYYAHHPVLYMCSMEIRSLVYPMENDWKDIAKYVHLSSTQHITLAVPQGVVRESLSNPTQQQS